MNFFLNLIKWFINVEPCFFNEFTELCEDDVSREKASVCGRGAAGTLAKNETRRTGLRHWFVHLVSPIIIKSIYSLDGLIIVLQIYLYPMDFLTLIRILIHWMLSSSAGILQRKLAFLSRYESVFIAIFCVPLLGPEI